LYDDQIRLLKTAFPGVVANSIGYASVDGGHLGYFDCNRCSNFEHMPFKNSSIVEIIDPETSEPITELGKPGLLIYTNLTRKLMPIIRYPVGDMACWVDRDGRFKLKGRSDIGARIGPVTLGRDDVVAVIKASGLEANISTFQMIIDHIDGLDRLTLRVVYRGKAPAASVERTILDSLYTERSMLNTSVQQRVMAPVRIDLIGHEDLIINDRTGKMRIVIDRRDR